MALTYPGGAGRYGERRRSLRHRPHGEVSGPAEDWLWIRPWLIENMEVEENGAVDGRRGQACREEAVGYNGIPRAVTRSTERWHRGPGLKRDAAFMRY